MEIMKKGYTEQEEIDLVKRDDVEEECLHYRR